MRKIALTIIISLAITTAAAAQTLTSPSYTLINPRIVISGGSAASETYSLNYVEIGNIFGSLTGSANYTLDTTPAAKSGITAPPFIVIESPLDGAIVYTDPIEVTGTIDAVPFSETRDLALGANLVVIKATNGVYASSKYVEVYLIREPIKLPQ